MSRFQERDRSLIAQVRDQLSILRVNGPPALTWFVPELGRSLGARAAASYGVQMTDAGVAIEFTHLHGELPADTVDRQQRVWAHQAHSWIFNPSLPEPAQRNEVFTVAQLMQGPGKGKLAANLAAHREHGLDLEGQVRALICDGPSLLAFVAVFHPEPGPRIARVLQALVEPLLRRLRLERQLESGMGPLANASLEAALERVGCAAFLVGPRGVTHANSAGRALLDHEPRARSSLREVALGRRGELAFEVTQVSVPGLPLHWLALHKSDPADPEPRAARLALRWSLTQRQREVLVLLADGLANKTLAATLKCAESTVERHVHALFEKAQVDSRAALIARFWTER